VAGLQKKLKWYVENQQWLDRDSVLLSQKDAEIAELTEKLRQLRTDVSHFMLMLNSPGLVFLFGM